MISVDRLGRKYAVGKMAQVMVTCNERLFKMQEDVCDASRHIMAIKDVPAVCKSSSTCFGNNLIDKEIHKKTPINRRTSLVIPPASKNVQDLRLRKVYQKLLDLESIGRSEWLKVFMYMSSYKRILRPLERGKWDEPEKFVQRKTLTLDGPYPGISSNLIIADDKPSNIIHSDKIGRKPPNDYFPEYPSMNVENMELNYGLGNEKREFLFTASPCPQKSSKYDPKILNCDCLESVHYRSPISSENRKNYQLVGKLMRPKLKNLKKYDYCLE